MSTTKKLKAAQKAKDKQVITLRGALFTDSGGDKDVTEGIAPAFMKYDRRGCDFVVDFSTKLSAAEVKWAFKLVKANMEGVYDASGYGWDDSDKERELTEPGGRFLLVRERESSKLVGFCHFRFTVQGDVMDVMVGDPCIYVWDMQIEDEHLRKGVGKHLLTLLSLIGTREKMLHLCLPVQMFDDRSRLWVESVRGFAPDRSLKKLIGFDAEMEGFEVYSKALVKPKPPPSLPKPSATSIADNTSKASVAPVAIAAASESVVETVTKANEASEQDEEDDDYDIVSKEEVKHVNAEGAEQDEEEAMNEEEIVAGLQLMFTQKHNRAATPDEVAQWMGAISGLDGSPIERVQEEQ